MFVEWCGSSGPGGDRPVASPPTQGSILRFTRTRTHVVGSDVRGGVAPVGWSFVLPSRHVASAAEVAVRLSGSLAAVVPDSPARVLGLDEVARCPPGSLDLIDVSACDPAEAPELAAAVACALASGGTVRGTDDWDGPLRAAGLRPSVRCWAAPAEAPVAFVPASDGAMIQRFRGARRDRAGYGHIRGGAGGRAPAAGSLVLYGPAGTGVGDAPPAWLQHLAAEAGIDVSGHRWGLWARTNYTSQKLVFFLHRPGDDEPDLVVKLPRTPEFNHRLQNEATAMEAVRSHRTLAPTVPATEFSGWDTGLFVHATRGVPGPAMPQVQPSGAGGPLVDQVIDWVTRLGTETARPAEPADVAVALADVVQRFEALYRPTTDLAAFLHRQVDLVAAATHPVPVVLMHGNVTDWNVIVPPEGPPVLVDWEFAESAAPPLWDLLYFLRMEAWGPARGWQRLASRWRRRTDSYLAPRDRAVLGRRIRRYCDAVGVPPEVVAPLYHLCWVHLCLNEATHRTPDQLHRAANLDVLRRGVALAARGELGPVVHPGRLASVRD